MIKNLRYLCTLLLIAVASAAWGEEETFSYSDYQGQGTQSSGSEFTMEKTAVSIKNTKFFGNTSYAHFYANGMTTITPATGVTITQVVLTASASGYNGYQSSGTIIASTGEVSGSGTTVTWTGSANSAFTLENNKQIRWTSIVVTYTPAGSTPTCASPSFNPPGGTYASAQNVTISCATDDATIYYTTNGDDPTTSSSVYSSAILVSETTTVKALATASGYNNSSVTTATYTITDPSTIAQVREQGTGSVFTKGIVTSCVGTTGYIQDATAAICVYGASLTVGDEITVSGTLSTYKGLLEITNPFVVVLSSGNTVTPTVKTIAEINDDDYTSNSSIQGLYVTIENATVTAINDQNTTIAQGNNTIVVRGISGVDYSVNDILTLNGNIGCFEGAQIANPKNITVQQSTKPTCATPTFSPTPGTYTEVKDVTISCETTGATIYYTTDGSNPTTSSSVYSSAINVSETTTIKAMAVASDHNNSEVAVATYTINLPYTGDPYVRVTDLNTLTDGARVIIAARYDGNATSYYAMTAATTGKPAGVSFTSSTSDNGECLPSSIVDIENTYYWTVGVTDNGYTFTNANNKALGYSSSTNFAEGGSNTEWVITRETSGSSAMVSGYEGFYIRNYSTINASTVRGIALNNQNNYGPYSTGNNNSSDYNFYLDIFVQGATSVISPSISVEDVNIAADATSGEIKYTINNPVTGTNLTATLEEGVDWISDVTVDAGNSKVKFTATANTGDERSAVITLSYGELTKEVTVTQAKYVAPFTPVTYTLAASITPGKHYIIVGTKDDKVQAMGYDKGNNRAAADGITIEGNTATVTSADVYEFMIGGNAKDGYTIYDQSSESTGYLYAAGNDKNYLKTQAKNDANGLWTITFGEGGVASIVASQSSNRNVMQYNSGSSLFSCYADASQSPVYLYEKDGEVLEAYAVVVKNEEEKPVSLTFYYDDQKANRGGEGITIVDIVDGTQNEYKAWTGTYAEPNQSMTTATFDVSFKNYTGLTRLVQMFAQCRALKTINGLTNLNTSNVTNMNTMFLYCQALESLDLSNFNTEKVSNMAMMFQNCETLTSLDLSTFNTAKVYDMSGMFYNCYALKSLDLSTFNTAIVRYMGSMFSSCKALEGITLSDNFTTENVEIMSYMFYLCENLAIIDVSKFNTDKVTTMEGMFGGTKVASLDLSHFNTAKVKSMIRMFYLCKDLTSVDLSSFNTELVTENWGMFDFCNSLKTIYVGDGWNTDNVTNSASNFMLQGCDVLVGGAGTAFDASKATDKTFAILDGGAAAPGYLTYKTVPAPPTFSPASGEYTDAQTVTITAAEGTTIYYTTDGTEPDAQKAEQVYTEPVTISQTATLKAIAVKGAISEVASAEYKITATTLQGDVNGDKKVDVADVTALVNIIVKEIAPTDAQIAAGNLDPDEGLTVNDVKALVEKILTDSNQ